MDTGSRQYDVEQQQRAVARLIAVIKVSSADYRKERIDTVKIGLDEGISVYFVCEARTKMDDRWEGSLHVVLLRKIKNTSFGEILFVHFVQMG